ncbi:MAG: hypothetical protein R2865_07400 [Deinococcales bacterium]
MDALTLWRTIYKDDNAGKRLHEIDHGFFLKGIDTGLDEVFEQDFQTKDAQYLKNGCALE